MYVEIMWLEISPRYLYRSSEYWKGCWYFTVYRC